MFNPNNAKFPLKVVLNKQKTKVLYAEKNEDDVDINALVPKTSKFLTAEAEALFKKYHGRSMIDERRIAIDVFEQHNLVSFFRNKGMLATVTTALPFSRNVIFEFYSNLLPQVNVETSASYGRVFVRGELYKFTPELINQSMGTEDYKGSSVVDDMDEAIAFLTGGKVTKWKEQFPAARLTSLYSVLHKVAIFNWIPSKNSTVVTRPQAQFLYRIGRGIQFNFGQMVFDIVTRFAQSKAVSSFVFPSLIFNILEAQGFVALEGEIMTGDAELFTLRNQYLKGDRIVDLPWVNPRRSSSIAGVDTSAGNTKSNMCQFSRADVEAHIIRLKAQQDQIQVVIDALQTSLLPSDQVGEIAGTGEDEEKNDVAVDADNITDEEETETNEEFAEAAAMRARKGKRVAENEPMLRRSQRRRRN
ncbi:hypothetical protein CASFOL_020007 [Castilleja foliolosa]|uniref:Putative plant transposon protein domain-containing protein n=1 Tax=Castilleja foliolosa TaxID=1961234 RepID=A0ABD3CZM0_9LAMI